MNKKLKNKNSVCLNPQYSTTRRLISDKGTHYRSLYEQQYPDKSGGLRLSGLLKESSAQLPLISIITVVFNGEQYLEETLLSVINQDYENIEFIVVDGGSSDGTLEIIKKYEDYIDLWISSKDNGVYDAMNKGIELATGTYLNFLNASDYFYDKHAISSIFENYNNADVIYGNIYVSDEHGRIPFYLQAHELTYSNLLSYDCAVLNHQAMFIKKEISPFYNLKYKYRAELNWYYDIIEKLGDRAIIRHIDVPVVYYRTGGISYKRLWGPLYEWIGIEFKRGGFVSILRKIPSYTKSILNYYGMANIKNKSANFIKKPLSKVYRAISK